MMKNKHLSLALVFVRRHAYKIGSLFTIILILAFFYESTVVLEPGILAKEAPIQINIKDLEPAPKPWFADDHSFLPLASYTLEAKVLGKERYRTGKESKLSPYDLALGWQELSDQAIVDKISISQSGRWYYYKYSDLSISQSMVSNKSANNHIIPANDKVLEVLHDIRKGDIVVLDGYLVEIRNSDGWSWRSSLTRTDTGAHACEVFWVESANIITP